MTTGHRALIPENFDAEGRQRMRIHTDVSEYPLDRANDALNDLRSGRIQGAAVLRMAHTSS